MTIPNGVYPVMLTPFTPDFKIDYKAVEGLIEFYRKSGCEGIFAICASSEMDALTLKERVELAEFIAKRKGNMTIVCSGHVSLSHEMQVEELSALAQTGIDAQILIVSRLTAVGDKQGNYADESAAVRAEIMLENVKRLMDEVKSDLPFGFYERPGEGNIAIPEAVLKYCVEDGRFVFLKDTTCTIEGMQKKLDITKGSNFKLFNANTTFLYETLKIGAAGYSGTCANFHPDLFVWLCKNWEKHPKEAERLSYYLGVLGQATSNGYRLSAKYYLDKYETPMNVINRDAKNVLAEQCLYLQEGMRQVQEDLRAWLKTIK